MAVREILLLGNPLLRTRCARVKNFSDAALTKTVTDLQETLAAFRLAHGFGRGIAAPQIGVSQRIVFINIDGAIPIINPEIIRRSRRVMTLWDDCFSFPDILVKVRRHLTVTVKYQDLHGKRHDIEASGDLSELLQHEIDHLDGILAIDRAIDSKHIILRSEWDKLKQHAKDVVQL